VQNIEDGRENFTTFFLVFSTKYKVFPTSYFGKSSTLTKVKNNPKFSANVVSFYFYKPTTSQEFCSYRVYNVICNMTSTSKL